MTVKVDRRVVLAALLGACSPSPEEPTGNIIYMSPSGNDTNNGAFDTPVWTAGRATDLCAPGDTVYVRGGIYSGNQTISKNGLAGQKITMRPYPGETVIFDGTNSNADSNLITIFSDYFIFMGFIVRNGKFANISCFDTHDTEIRNCIIHDAWINGVQIKALNNNKASSYENIVEGNEIYNCVKENAPRTRSGGWGQALSFGGSNNSVARNNFVHNNMGEGIVSIVSKGCLIEDNHVRDNYSVQIYLDNAPNTTVRRNRIGTPTPNHGIATLMVLAIRGRASKSPMRIMVKGIIYHQTASPSLTTSSVAAVTLLSNIPDTSWRRLNQFHHHAEYDLQHA